MLRQFNTHISQLAGTPATFLIAVSGGVDSVVLVDMMHRLGYAFEIAHCNFQLRGEESYRDENFVKELAAHYGKTALVKKFDTEAYATAEKKSIQEAARELRYAWFAEIADELKIDSPIYIATAHHADDNIETMLMRFFRGTGIQGLVGIPALDKERKLIRPLLPFRKDELIAYARENELSFVEDSSNASGKYTRNFFRNTLLPQVREVFPQVDDNLLHNIERLKEASQLYSQSVRIHLSKLTEQKQNEVHVPVLKLKKTTPLHTITWELIKPFGFHSAQTMEVLKLLDAVNGSSVSSSTHRIIRNRGWLIIAPLAKGEAQHLLIGANDKHVSFGERELSFKSCEGKITGNPLEAFVDPSSIQYPLLLRKWKTGDYFYPLGMQKKKKLNRFFIDRKLSATEKENVWVLECNRKIVWVIGYRIDDRFKITDLSKPALCITCSGYMTEPHR